MSNTFETYFRSLSVEKQAAIGLYQQVAAAMNQLYQVICDRTTYKEWEDPFKNSPQDLGIGDCHLSTIDSAQEIVDEDILVLRQRRSVETPGPQFSFGCDHHRKGVGCILGDLKSPFCIRYFRNPLLDEMKRRFGIEVFTQFDQAKTAAVRVLKQVQDSSLPLVDKQLLVAEVIEKVRQAQNLIEPFPTIGVR